MKRKLFDDDEEDQLDNGKYSILIWSKSIDYDN
jgi:hypothetical protein